MSKATEAALADLHGEVARALTAVAKGSTDPETGAVIPASAAHLAVAVAFLKNNSITADPSTNGDLDALSKALAERRSQQKGRLTQRDLDAATEQLERDLPGMMQ